MLHHSPDELLKSLLDNLSTERIEIDMIEFSVEGAEVAVWDSMMAYSRGSLTLLMARRRPSFAREIVSEP